MRLGRLAVLLGAVLVSLFPSSASGAVVVGNNLSLPPTLTLCVKPGSLSLSCTAAITALPAASRASGGFRVETTGVITSWSVRAGNSTVDHSVRLRVIRNEMGAGTGPTETLPEGAGIYTYPARLPVVPNDFLGLDMLNVPEGIGVPILRSTSGAYLDYWIGPLADGESRAPTTNESPSHELLINATIEPDADGDGFGDETQDQCSTSAATQGSCPTTGGGGGTGGGSTTTPPPPAAPETILGKKPAGTIHARKATFRFNANIAGSTFQCKLDKKPFRLCKSPKTYKGLSEGRHTFKVRAVGPTGLIDPTPGKRTFKVEL